jgi:ribosome-associated translation inhibitor RaiA
MVVLERDGISASLSRVPEITPAMREEVTKRAERMYDELKQKSAAKP